VTLVAGLVALGVSAPVCEGEPLPVPTRAEVIVSERAPVTIKGKALAQLSALLRNQASYDPTRAARCHEPRHLVRFYYGESLLDAYNICFECENVSITGSSPFVGCEPTGASAAMPDRLTFTTSSLERLRTILANAKVALVPKAAQRH